MAQQTEPSSSPAAPLFTASQLDRALATPPIRKKVNAFVQATAEVAARSTSATRPAPAQSRTASDLPSSQRATNTKSVTFSTNDSFQMFDVGDGNQHRAPDRASSPPDAEQESWTALSSQFLISQTQHQQQHGGVGGAAPRRKIPGPIGALTAEELQLMAENSHSGGGGSSGVTTGVNGSVHIGPRVLGNRRREDEDDAVNTPKESDFRRMAWLTMLQDCELFPLTAPPRKLGASIRQILEGQFPKKVPELLVLVKSIKSSDLDASVTFADPSGKIKGTVHKRVLEQLPDMSAGAVLLLTNVSVFHATRKTHFLVVTPDNVSKFVQKNTRNTSIPREYMDSRRPIDPLIIYDQALFDLKDSQRRRNDD
jgi:hypothetical protein